MRGSSLVETIVARLCSFTSCRIGGITCCEESDRAEYDLL